MTGVSAQMADELDRMLAVETILGSDVAGVVAARIGERAEQLAAAIDDGDLRVVTDMMATLWPHGSPEEVGRADWWRTPLGRACARSLARVDTGGVSYSVAAAMLGLARGTVSTMVHRGNLARHPGGGVLRASVLQRLGRVATSAKTLQESPVGA